MADGILHYFALSGGDARRGPGRDLLRYVVTMPVERGAQATGHMALSRVIGSDLCDFLLSPFDYSQRAVGEPTTIMSATGSVLAHGSWGMEADLRTG